MHTPHRVQMKGAEPKESEAEIDGMLKALRLEPKRDSQSYTLSGGMKRKLCVGIALVGGSKIVLLGTVEHITDLTRIDLN